MKPHFLLAMLPLVLWPLVGVFDSGVAADEAPKSKPHERWVKYYKEVAQGYDMRLESAPDEPLTVVVEPVLVYSNPTSGRDTHGAFFVWTRNGRAEVIAAFWSKLQTASVESDRSVNHEFQSLATEPLVAKGKDGVRWVPTTPGIEFKPVPDAPVPAQSRGLRLAQMREITRHFSGYDIRQDGVDGAAKERTLRVLPAPLFRYAEDPKQTGSVDGAVFAFFYEWDPEIILVIEARPTRTGSQWQYGVGRVDNKPLRLEYDHMEVWKKPGNDLGDANSKYYTLFGVTTRSNKLE